MPEFTHAELRSCLQALRVIGPASGPALRHVLIDSRRVFDAPRTVFLAFPGRHTHGERFLPELYDRGVRTFVLENLPSAPREDATYYQVADIRRALQALARCHRSRFAVPVVGITGSNGKTVVKEWLYQLLSADRVVHRSPRSFNSQIGVPLSVLGLEPRHELAIFEAGISRVDEMARLVDLIRPTVGILTNIGDAHAEGFQSPTHKLAEKLRLFSEVETLIYGADHALVHDYLREHWRRPTFTWSRHADADVRVLDVQVAGGSSVFHLCRGDQAPFRFSIPFVDDNSRENAMHACCLLLWLGYRPEEIAARMPLLRAVDLRLRLRAGRADSILIDDSYSNDLTSLATALDLLERQGQPERPRWLILSDLLETGLPTEAWCRQVAALIGSRISRLVGVGPAIPAIQPFLPAHLGTHFFPGTEALLSALPDLPWQGSLLLVKGARTFRLERVTQYLTRQVHRTELEIDLDRLVHNLRVFQRCLKPNVHLAVMVKAAAYGTGGGEVARVLARQGIRYLVVAYPDEGRTLREAGIDHPIFVLNAEPHTYGLLAAYRLEPEVYHWKQLAALETQANLPIHLKFDTGMHRLGFRPEEAGALGEWLRAHPRLKVASIMTHLAASGDPRHDAFTHEQVRRFEAAYATLLPFLPEPPPRHVLNSSGILRFPQYHFDMVRLGIGLYGPAASGHPEAPLETVLRLSARISQVIDVPAGETVGYGRAGRLTRDSRVATLGIGYADGLPRAVGHGRFAVNIHGRRAPIIGAVCMDMCMVDVTDIPEAREGDMAVIFGEDPNVAELARAAGTIPYEILTGLSERVHRLYLHE